MAIGAGGGRREENNRAKEREEKEVEMVGSPPSSPRVLHLSLPSVDPLLPKTPCPPRRCSVGPGEGCPQGLAIRWGQSPTGAAPRLPLPAAIPHRGAKPDARPGLISSRSCKRIFLLEAAALVIAEMTDISNGRAGNPAPAPALAALGEDGGGVPRLHCPCCRHVPALPARDGTRTRSYGRWK